MTQILGKHHKEYTKVNLERDRGRTGRLGSVLDQLGLRNAKILDIGCGPGVQFLGHMEGHEFTGVDIAHEALASAEAISRTARLRKNSVLPWFCSSICPVE